MLKTPNFGKIVGERTLTVGGTKAEKHDLLKKHRVQKIQKFSNVLLRLSPPESFEVTAVFIWLQYLYWLRLCSWRENDINAKPQNLVICFQYQGKSLPSIKKICPQLFAIF